MTETKVLIVDDSRDIADLYALHLKEDYQTEVAYSGEEALEKCDGSIDLMLLDRRMPKYAGDEVLDEVRSNGLEFPVIFVSAVSKDTDGGKDADDYLQKPITKEELIEVIENNIH